jgi:hypothetical protein
MAHVLPEKWMSDLQQPGDFDFACLIAGQVTGTRQNSRSGISVKYLKILSITLK